MSTGGSANSAYDPGIEEIDNEGIMVNEWQWAFWSKIYTIFASDEPEERSIATQEALTLLRDHINDINIDLPMPETGVWGEREKLALDYAVSERALTPIAFAAMYGQTEITLAILNIQDEWQFDRVSLAMSSALNFACDFDGLLALAAQILDQHTTLLMTQTEDGSNVLRSCISYISIDRGRNPTEDFFDLMQLALLKGADVNGTKRSDSPTPVLTPLEFALDLLRGVWETPASVWPKTDRSSLLRVISFLIAHGANPPDPKKVQNAAIENAFTGLIETGDAKGFQFFIDAKLIDFDKIVDNQRTTPLIQTILNTLSNNPTPEKISIAENSLALLINAGVNLDEKLPFTDRNNQPQMQSPWEYVKQFHPELTPVLLKVEAVVYDKLQKRGKGISHQFANLAGTPLADTLAKKISQQMYPKSTSHQNAVLGGHDDDKKRKAVAKDAANAAIKRDERKATGKKGNKI